jgi:glucose-1-phosphate cytidylyltransferase
MQIVILAGGTGSRLSEETHLIPKPMIKIGELPLIHHLIEYFSINSQRGFIVTTGYKSEGVNDYFNSDSFKIYAEKNSITVDCVFTGQDSLTGKRIAELEPLIRNDFIITYGDGLTDLPLDSLIDFHRSHGKVATVTAVHPPARFGSLRLAGTTVVAFDEKNPQKEGWINGGFFCTDRRIFDFIPKVNVSLESAPMNNLVDSQELAAFKYEGWWFAMDTLRDKRELQGIWDSGKSPWTRRLT